MRKSLIFMSFLLFTTTAILAQSLSTDTYSVGNSNLPSVGSTFNVPVNISGFPGTVRYVESVVIFDPSVLEYIGTANHRGGFAVSTATSTPLTGMLKLNYNNGLSGLSAADGKIFDIQFKYKGGNSVIDFRTTPATPPSRWRSAVSPYPIANITTVTNGSITGGFCDNTIGSGNWNTPEDWSTGVVPTIWHNVTVGNAGLVTVADNGTANSVVVSDGGQLTLDASKTLTVTDEFKIASGGSFIQNGALTAATTKAERYIGAWGPGNAGWHLISSPVSGQSIAGSWTPAAVDYEFFAWSEPQQLWMNQRDPTNGITTFQVGQGYLVSYRNAETREFAGSFNGAAVSYPITLSTGPGENYGFNLVGNPYPSAINVGDLTGPINGTVKVWLGLAYTDVNDGYATGSYIPAMNGFMVEATAGGNVSIPLSARAHNGTAWMKNTTERILLVARNTEEEFGQESVLRFDAGASNEFDSQFDSHFLGGYAPQFYSTIGDEKLSTNTLPEKYNTLEVPYSFVKNAGTSFVIELKESIAEEDIFLTDLKTNYTQNMILNPVYAFTSEEGDAANRFKVTFSGVGVTGVETNALNAYVFNQNLYVVNPTNGSATVEIFNVQGQLMGRHSVQQGLQVLPVKAAAGVYVVRLTHNGNTYNAKVFNK